MKMIPLTKGLEAVIDDSDYERVSVHKWYAQRLRHNFYAARGNGRGKLQLMHRFLLNAKEGEFVDHLNRNTLDNRMLNIRITTRGVNGHNRIRGLKNKTGFRGVSKVHGAKTWRASIKKNGVPISLGCFATPKDAAIIYDQAALYLYGEHAVTNFDRSAYE